MGDFIRAKRAAVSPADVGLPSGGARRVSGLRREEVAVICGISVDYYTRIEQGREHHPSANVTEALARGLRMNADERLHLYALAGLASPRSNSPAECHVSPELQRLIGSWPTNPAVILDELMNVVARNRLWRLLYSGYGDEDNMARMTFLHPHGRAFHADWSRAAQATVANLRAVTGRDASRADAAALIEQLSEGSSDFRRLWAQQDVRGKTHEPKEFRHPRVGPLTLTYHAFDVRGAPGQQLLVYEAEPGSESAAALALLSSFDDPARTPGRAGWPCHT
ncbi:transcriptional regulator [Mycolicibacterium grossiae]|uniref:Transcriptional regulator n=1 Tax=Mycolicibacterium grossiae TaxID=1552759 RepID=A0A1E8PYT2_9MYCO|nr:transcriptional regulator [Mycolicibacterium grossiae]